MIDPVLHWVTALCLAVLWLDGALFKWRNRATFRQSLAGYQLVPRSAMGPLTHGLITLEGLLAVALLVPALREKAAGVAALMLMVYAGAMATSLLRGLGPIDCGCGGNRKVSWLLVLRNTGLALAACRPSST